MSKIKKVFLIITLLALLLLPYIIPFSTVKAYTKPLVIVLDPGHGGVDPGAVNNSLGLKEREVNFKIAQYLRAELLRYDDVEVYLTHEGLPSNYKLELYERANIAQNYNADICISLHINATGGRGAEVYVTRDTSEVRYNQKSTQLGNSILKQLAGLGIANRGVKTRKGNTIASEPKQYYYGDFEIDYYGMIRYPRINGIPGIIIEHCFIDNYDDAQFITTDAKIKAIAIADAKGIVEHYGLVLKDPSRVKSVSLDKTSAQMIEGTTLKLNPTVSPDTAVNKNVTWSSSDTSIATVDGNGMITAVKEGTTNITVSVGTKKDTAKITVKKLAVGQKIEIKNLKNEYNVLTRVKAQTKVEDFIQNFDISTDLEIIIKDPSGKVLGNGDIITTETQIYVGTTSPKEVIRQYETIIYGDINKDGKISAADYVMIKNHIMETNLLSKKMIGIADVSRDSKITAADYVLIKNHIMNGTNLNIE